MHRIVDSIGVAEASIGKVVPYAFGTLPQVPTIPTATGAQATLREAMTATVPATGGRIKINSLAALRRFPLTGTVQIEGERCAYTGHDETPDGVALTGITRAADSSVAAAHAIGVAVNQVLARHVYVVCENPGQHFTQSIDAVYLNGILKPADTPPTHVVNLNDTNVLFDDVTGDPISVVSVTFDLSTITAAQSEYIIPSTLEALKKWLETYGAHTISGGSGAMVLVPPDSNLLTSAPPEDFAAIIRIPGRPKIFPVPQLGLVEVDLQGLQDDASGTITGTPSLPLTRPAHITHCLLREAFEQRAQGAAFDLASWTTAATYQGVYNLAWAMLFQPVDYPTLQRLVSIQSRTDVYRDPGGRGWRAVFRRRATPSYTSTTARRLACEYQTTQAQAVITTLTVTYGEGTQQATLSLDSATALDRFSNRTDEILMPWVPSAAVATALGQFQLTLRDHVRREATVTEAWAALATTRTDAVDIDSPILDPYGDFLPWRVRGFRVRPDFTLILDCEEEALGFEEWLKPGDSIALSLAEQVTITATGALAILAADTLALGLTDAASVILPTLVSASESLSVGLSEQVFITIPISLTAADIAAVGLSSSASVLIPTLLTATDADGLAIVDVATAVDSTGEGGGGFLTMAGA